MTATSVAQRDGLKVVRQTFGVSSATRRQAIDVTLQVRGGIHGAGVSNGLILAEWDGPRPRQMQVQTMEV